MEGKMKHNLDDIRETYFTEYDIPEIDRKEIDKLIKREKELIDNARQ